MNAETLLCELAANDIRLQVHEGRLRVDAPRGMLTDDLHEAIKSAKPELLALLSEQAAPTPAAGYAYCPGCRATTLLHEGDTVTCTACKAFWLPSIDLAIDSPNATIRVTNPITNRDVLIGIYRCPRCRETRWGPKLDGSGMWCCLRCAGVPDAQRDISTRRE